VLVASALPEGDLKIYFLGCSKPGVAFGVKLPVKQVIKALRKLKSAARGVQ
jgi:hypothetical protein